PMPPDLPPFPTRRSSDLDGEPPRAAQLEQAFGAVAPHSGEQGRHAAAAPMFCCTAKKYIHRRAVHRLGGMVGVAERAVGLDDEVDRKSTRLNSSHVEISY